MVGLEGGLPSYSGASTYYDGGLYRTEDGGETWERVSTQPNNNKNGFWNLETVVGKPESFITFGFNFEDLSESVGFLTSNDGGRTWEELPGRDLTPLRITTFSLSTGGSTIYAHERDSFAAWVSRDGGSSWAKTGLVQINGPIAVSPADASLVIFGSQNKLMRSTNALGSAATVATAPQPPGHSRLAPFHDIVFAPSDPKVVYAATEGYLVYRSTNGGASFTLMKNVRADMLNVQP